MTIHRQHLTRALMIAALAAGAWTAAELATDGSAHADDKPLAVTADQPGGLVERTVQLPEQAADRAKKTVAKVTAEPSAPGEPEPGEDQGDEPTPAPSTPAEPEPTTDPEPASPADEPPVELPPVELPLPTPTPTEPLPAPVEVPPLPAPPVELPPAPADLPDPVSQPTGPAVVVPVALPVDPIPAPPPAGTVVTQLIADLTGGTDLAADCDGTPDDARRIDRDALRHLLAGLDRKPAPTTAQKPAAPGCPGTPDRGTPGGLQVKPPPPTAADMVVAYLARSHVPPVLARLEHTRARSHLPAGRSPHIEPGPA